MDLNYSKLLIAEEKIPFPSFIWNTFTWSSDRDGKAQSRKGRQVRTLPSEKDALNKSCTMCNSAAVEHLAQLMKPVPRASSRDMRPFHIQPSQGWEGYVCPELSIGESIRVPQFIFCPWTHLTVSINYVQGTLVGNYQYGRYPNTIRNANHFFFR